jgi:hypothetical protein
MCTIMARPPGQYQPGPADVLPRSTVYSAYNCVVWRHRPEYGLPGGMRSEPGADGRQEELHEYRVHCGFDPERNSLQEVFAVSKRPSAGRKWQ